MAPLQMEIVTAEGRIFSGETDSVTAPGSDGQLTILPSHAPIITSLDDGDLKFIDGSGEHHIAILGDDRRCGGEGPIDAGATGLIWPLPKSRIT